MHSRRQLVVVAFSVLFWVLPVAAQVQFDGLHMGMGGDINAGYSGDISTLGGSDHGLGIGGNGTLQGSYYNPNFLSFTVLPYYNRSQSNADGASIFDTGGYNGNVSIFAGSHFPGNISFNQVWDSTGTFGIPGETGLTTKDSSRSIGIGWSELVPGLPSLTASFQHASNFSSVPGSDAQDDFTENTFGIRSSYRVAGWNLGAAFTHLNSDSNTNDLLGSGEVESKGSSNGFELNAGHNLPLLRGGFGVGFSRTDYSTTFGGSTVGSNNGTTDNAYANLNVLAWRFPISATATYTGNVYGGFEEYLLANGGSLMETNLTPETRSLIVNVSTVYHVMPHVFASGYLTRSELYYAGGSSGATQFGGTLNFNFGEHIRGLTATVGADDMASRYGNTGATLVANANYFRNIGHWEFMANFNYNQYVQTMVAIYQTSNMNYNAQIHRQFAGGFSWSIGGGGGRTAFPTVSGDVSQGESVGSGLSWRLCRCTLTGNYSHSNGTSVLTAQGLVPVPAPVVSANLMTFDARNHGFSFSISPARGLSFNTAYNKSNSITMSPGTPSSLATNFNNETELITGMLSYRFRKLTFSASALQFRQGITGADALPSVVTSYYFSVSRWLKVF